MTFALRGNKSPQVYSAFSRSRLEITGCFHTEGRQIVGNGEGECPQWVADFFTANPKVTELAISTGTDGVSYTPLAGENASDQTPRTHDHE